MEYKIVSFDFEVNKDWWCCGFMDEEHNYLCFESGHELDLIDYIIKNKSNTIFVGYNSFHFDDWCMKCIFNGVNPWKVVQKVIVEELSPWNIKELRYKKDVDFLSFDLMRALGVGAPSLKDIAANLGLEIKFSESIVNGKDQNLTREEKDIMIQYNKQDCYVTIELYKHLKPTLDSYLTLIDKFNLPKRETLRKKKAQLFEVIGEGKFKKQLTPYEYNYTAPKFIELKENKNVQKIMEKFSFTDENEFEHILMWDGYEYKFGRGGAHYAIKNYIQEFDDDHIFVMNDFASFYPGMMCNKTNPELRFIDPIINWEVVRGLVDMRLDAKKTNPALAEALKVPINAMYGKTIDKFFKYSYWPAGLNICLTGQLITLWICETLKRENIGKLIQVNTDGFYYLISKDEVEKFTKIMNEFQSKIGIDFETEMITKGKIIQKDVNNYIIYDEEKDHYKVKGALVRKYKTKQTYVYHACSIIDDAIVDYLVKKVPISTTILNAFNKNEADKFMLIYNMKGKNYEACYYGDKIVNKINRGFATGNKELPDIRKMKGGTKCKFPDMPEHVYIYNDDMKDFDIRKISLDVQWYISKASNGVTAFLGGQ